VDIFNQFYPQPVDISQLEYEADKDNIDQIAKDNGYTFVGYTDKRAVFSTKPQ